jgi:hypothetical protein
MPEQCEQKAAECLRLARVMMDSTNKALLHQMALAWIERANQIRAKATTLSQLRPNARHDPRGRPVSVKGADTPPFGDLY